MTLQRFLVAALALAAASTASAALMDNNCRVDARVFQTTGGVYVTVEVDAIWGALIDGDLHLTVNNQEVKMEPVYTNNQMISTTWVAPPGHTVTACAHVVGRNWINAENWLPADSTDCAYYNGEVQPNIPGAGGATLRPPVVSGSSLSRMTR